jgi:hypothetical protein
MVFVLIASVEGDLAEHHSHGFDKKLSRTRQRVLAETSNHPTHR